MILTNIFEKIKLLLWRTNYSKTLNEFIIENIIFSLIVSTIFSLFLFLTNISLEIILIFFTFFSIIFFIGKIFLKFYLFEKNINELETEIPSFLFYLSMFSFNEPLDKIIFKIFKENNSFLANKMKEFANSIKNGCSINLAFDLLKKKVPSSLFHKSLFIIESCYESTCNSSKILLMSAENLIELINSNNERNSNLIVQKYTLIISSAFFLPLIFSFILKFFNNFPIESIQSLISVTNNFSKDFLQLIFYANIIYVLEFSLIVSIFISIQEKHFSKVFFYFVPIFIIGLIIFIISSNLTIRGI